MNKLAAGESATTSLNNEVQELRSQVAGKSTVIGGKLEFMKKNYYELVHIWGKNHIRWVLMGDKRNDDGDMSLEIMTDFGVECLKNMDIRISRTLDRYFVGCLSQYIVIYTCGLATVEVFW